MSYYLLAFLTKKSGVTEREASDSAAVSKPKAVCTLTAVGGLKAEGGLLQKLKY